MDNLFIHLEPIQRLMPARLHVSSAGYLPRKTGWVRRSFETANFSFVMKGSGRLICEDHVIPVRAPCVLVQWPGVMYEYGPGEGQWWEELFVICPLGTTQLFEAWGIQSDRKPLWPILNMRRFYSIAEELIQMMRSGADVATADRADRIVERMVLESRLGVPKRVADPMDEKVERIRNRAVKQLHEDISFDELAKEEGMSPISFRRHWARRYDEPPARYLMGLRMQEACRLLVETGDSIAEIADQVGFEDALYFSRKFSRAFGMPATVYRRHFGRPSV